MKVPYFRLETTAAERAAVERVLLSGWLTTGAECRAFEQEFVAHLGGGVEAIAVNSNTAGLHLVLEALGIGPGDEVIVPSMTFTATAEVVRYVGADVRFVDVLPDTLNIDVQAVARAITPRTKAVIVVHFGGLAADMPALLQLAKKHDLRVVEDAAHALPADLDGTPVGRTGADATVFSFYANKTLTTGEGGMIVTPHAATAARCRVMRLHGIDRDSFARFTSDASQWRYDVVAPGFKYNLTDLAAALGREQLKTVEEARRKRRHVAERYCQAFQALPLKLPSLQHSGSHAWHLFPVNVPAGTQGLRDAFASSLASQSIGYSVHYTPLHRMTYWRERYQLQPGDFPVSDQHGETSLSLPLFPAMTDEEIEAVIAAVRQFWKPAHA